MAGEINIQGPLQFIGYLQDYQAGTNGQVLTYSNGNASWVNVPSTPPDNPTDIDAIVTSLNNDDAFISIEGDELVFDDQTYFGIDTIPSIEIITAQGGITCIDGGNIGLTDANFPINFDAGTI